MASQFITVCFSYSYRNSPVCEYMLAFNYIGNLVATDILSVMLHDG